MNSFEQPPRPDTPESRETPVKYLYHRVPENVVGDALYPLNDLKDKHPQAYKEEVSKYDKRQEVMQQRLPSGELWNDVLHLTPVHPSEVKQALIEAGVKDAPTAEWYQIPIGLINAAQATFFLKRSSGYGAKPEDFEPYDEQNLQSHKQLPEATKEYYREQIAAGEEPLLFLYAPHVLYHGRIPLAECTIITV